MQLKTAEMKTFSFLSTMSYFQGMKQKYLFFDSGYLVGDGIWEGFRL